MFICLPIKINSKGNNASDIPAGTILLNNFFAYWFMSSQVNIKRYRYQDKMLKYMTEKVLKTLEKTQSYNNKKGCPRWKLRQKIKNKTIATDRSD